MTVQAIMTKLKAKGNDGVKKIFLKHGIKEPLFGVKIEHLKVIQKKIKKDYQLAKDLYATGNADAMYLAGLIADEQKMTEKDLNLWVTQAQSSNIGDYTVPWVTAESNYGYQLVNEWIDSNTPYIAAAGWATLANLVAIKPDTELNIPALKKLLTRAETTIHQAPDSVRAKINSYIIALGIYVPALTADAIVAAKKIGVITIIKEGTACKTPDAIAYINKAKTKGIIGKKKKMARC
jgi:3-methyladenine DNA glycosylase AlkD